MLFTAAPALAHEIMPRAMSCAPSLPQFCANIHVGCAGRSKLATSAFRITIRRNQSRVEFAAGTGWPAVATQSGGDLILRPEGGRDWIRIQPDGTFSQRIYRKGRALMTHGKCRTE